MTITQALAIWNEHFPNVHVSDQTIRNWVRKYGLGNKDNFFPRSKWIVDEAKRLGAPWEKRA